MKDRGDDAASSHRHVSHWAQGVILVGFVIVLVGLLLPCQCADAVGTGCVAGLRGSRRASSVAEVVRAQLIIALPIALIIVAAGRMWRPRYRVRYGLAAIATYSILRLFSELLVGQGLWLFIAAMLAALFAITVSFDDPDEPAERQSWVVRGVAIATFLIALVLWLGTVGEVPTTIVPAPLVALIGATIMMVATFPDIVVDVPAAAAAPEHSRE